MPSVPRPPFLMVSEPGSFAEYTIVCRKPQIVADILDFNDYGPDIVAALRLLAEEIASRPVAPLREHTEDYALWQSALQPWEARSWRELPWFLAETYFYRRVLEAVRYFQPGRWHLHDPFAAQKWGALADGLRTLARFWQEMPLDLTLSDELVLWLRRSLWGNRADLSNAATLAHAHRDLPGQEGQRLVIDHTLRLTTLLMHGQVRQLDLVADNCGLELLCDLALLGFLLTRNLVESVRLHLKGQPYFVSDAMRTDLDRALEGLGASEVPALRDLGVALSAAQGASRLTVRDDPFWSTCLFYTQLPPALRQELAGADLLVLKGDVNYRRLLEDRHWPYTARLEDVAGYMPTSFAALRTLKGELIVGLCDGQAQELDRQDPQWLINGERGLVHLVEIAA